MALNKTLATHFGVSATYHRIAHISLQAKRQLDYHVVSYKDKEARDAQKAPLSSVKFVVSEKDLGLLPGGDGIAVDVIIAACYAHLKKQKDFDGAKDC